MTKREASHNGYISKKSAFTVVGIAFIFGVFVGILFTSERPVRTGPPATNSRADSDHRKMIEALVERTAREPGDVEAWTKLGDLYYDTQQFENAIQAYETSVALKPDNPDVLTDLGTMYHRSKQPEKAIASFERAISVDPRHNNAWFNKGVVLLHDLGDREGAIRAWEKLLEINPVAMTPGGQSLGETIRRVREVGGKR
jgi:cytochrome c-type biogenesis protein CcmH/NrfG